MGQRTFQPISRLVTALDDPRVSHDDYRRSPAGADGECVTLVGVVHGNPASAFRAASTVDTLDPAVVAVELAPLALPLFASYARDIDAGGIDAVDADLAGGPLPGGEMTAAMAASDNARVVGIDLPNASGLGAALDAARSASLSPRGIARAGYALAEQTAHAARCRVAHVAGRFGIDVDPGLDRRRSADRGSSPAAQAAAEREAVAAGTALLRSFTRPPSMEAFDRAREASMADQLRALRREGPVVAVVGHAHLDPIADRLAADRLTADRLDDHLADDHLADDHLDADRLADDR
ncbi:hypothetical protein [Halorubrum trueperi]|uniref:Uncharacterized protein n=1 Tax=Halorubrum trueperi TaxID=2004704 RepID=A0ABD5UIV5_9EURY